MLFNHCHLQIRKLEAGNVHGSIGAMPLRGVSVCTFRVEGNQIFVYFSTRGQSTCSCGYGRGSEHGSGGEAVAYIQQRNCSPLLPA